MPTVSRSPFYSNIIHEWKSLPCGSVTKNVTNDFRLVFDEINVKKLLLF